MADYELHAHGEGRALRQPCEVPLPRAPSSRSMGTGPNMRYYEGLALRASSPTRNLTPTRTRTRTGTGSSHWNASGGSAIALEDASVDTVVAPGDVHGGRRGAPLAEVRRVLSRAARTVPRPRGGAPGHAAADDADAQPLNGRRTRVQADARPRGR